MISLKDFTSNELEKYHIPVNKKNLDKLRNKFTKELKTSDLWNNASTQLIGRNQTKFFKEEDLEKISKKLSSYLIKLSIKEAGLDPKKIEKLKKQHQQDLDTAEEKWFNYISTHSQEEIENDLYNNAKPKLTTIEKHQALNELMIQALFNKFFTMTPEQKNTYLRDYASNFQDADLTYNDDNWIISQERLKHPEKYYYNKKQS